MKRRTTILIITMGILIVSLLTLSSCNYQTMDMVYNFDEAIVSLPDGTIVSGKVQSWRDYDNSDQIQVKIDGVTYLVHSVNCALISH